MSSTSKGVFAGLATGVFWGLPFLAPQVLTGFHPLDIAFVRFLFFGLVSAFFLRPAFQLWKTLSPRHRFEVVLLSALGFWFYSLCLFLGVRSTDGVISSLIVGLLPVTIALIGGTGRIRGGVLLGLVMIATGLFVLFGIPFMEVSTTGGSYSPLGILILFAALFLWSAYAIRNTTFLEQCRTAGAKDLSSLMGLLSVLFMTPIWWMASDPSAVIQNPDFPTFLVFGFLLGVGGSWFANWLWNICSRNCPPHISGPLIVSETIFGLLYSFAWESRLPQPYEFVAILLLITGVVTTVRAALKSNP